MAAATVQIKGLVPKPQRKGPNLYTDLEPNNFLGLEARRGRAERPGSDP